MSPMTYHRPTTLGQAKELSQTLENAVFMSGGHTLLPAMKQDLATPDHVIDLSHIGELETLRVDSNDLIIGAMSTHVQVATSTIVQELIPALAVWLAPLGIAKYVNGELLADRLLIMILLRIIHLPC